MPKGINTLIGERGIRLSGGQKQRLAIARAFYFNKSILILDESTSALDNETEKLIVEEIKRLKGSVTMIVIAHRLSTLKYCDRILYLENGKIKSQGPPENYIN
jgi:ABC-type bacteriocin/lantibiotic exporter with double-glycine peptidase domain